MAGLYSYGFPSSAELMAQARLLAGASVPSRRGIRREYGRAINDVSGFSKALVSLLRQSDIGGAYAQPLAQEQTARAAAAARLGALGPEFAGADIAAGAAGESGLSLLRSQMGSASAYGRKQPGIAAARGALGIQGLVNARTDALSKRNEDLSSSFLQALQHVRDSARLEASANADIDFRQQNLSLDALAAAATGSSKRKSQFWTTRGEVFDVAEKLFEGKREKVGANLETGQAAGYKVVRPSFSQAYSKLYHRYGQELVQQGHSRAKVRKMLRQALFSAGYPRPKKPSVIPGVGPAGTVGGPGGT